MQNIWEDARSMELDSDCSERTIAFIINVSEKSPGLHERLMLGDRRIVGRDDCDNRENH